MKDVGWETKKGVGKKYLGIRLQLLKLCVIFVLQIGQKNLYIIYVTLKIIINCYILPNKTLKWRYGKLEDCE